MAYVLTQYFIGFGPKFLDIGSQPSLDGSPRSLNTGLIWGQALKRTFKNFLNTL